MLKKYVNNEKGMALAAVLLAFTLITLIVSVSLSVSLGDTRNGVNSQNFVESSYIAKSAADIVSADIEKRSNEIKLMKDQWENEEDVDQKSLLLVQLNMKQAEFENLHIIPESNETCSVFITGLAQEPIEVNISYNNLLSPKVLEVKSTYNPNQFKGSAKIRLGTFEKITENFEIPAFDGRNSLYSWADIDMGSGNPEVIGYVSCGGEIDSKTIQGSEGDLRNISIIAPPSGPLSTNKELSQTKTDIQNGEATTITSNDSGYYGSISTDKFDITVETSEDEDVVMILSSLNINKNGGTITVNGEGNFYIFFKEDYTSAINSSIIFDNDKGGANHLNIIGTNSNGNPQTYLIAYNDYMQKWVNEHSGSEKYLIPIADWQTMTIMDTYNIKNGGDFDAYLYLPFGNLSFKNKAEVIGSIYAGYIDIKNGADITFAPYNQDDALYTWGGDSTVGATEAAIVTTYNLNKNKVWLRK